jgi:hypothetical protein
MKLFFAGGEGLPRPRQHKLFDDGVRHRLVSFFTGQGPTNKVCECARKWEENNAGTSNPTNEDEPFTPE